MENLCRFRNKYIHIHICTFTNIRCTCASIRTCAHIHVDAHVHICICLHVYAVIQMHIINYALIDTCTNMYLCTYAHVHTYLCKFAHILATFSESQEFIHMDKSIRIKMLENSYLTDWCPLEKHKPTYEQTFPGAYVCIFVHVRAYICICTHMCTYMHMCKYAYICTCAYLYKRICGHMHAYTRTFTHMHIHIYVSCMSNVEQLNISKK